MRYLYAGLDLIGFVALCTSSVAVSSVSSLLRWMGIRSIRQSQQALEALQDMNKRGIVSISKAEKNGSNWIVVRVWKLSLLVGVRNAGKSNQ